MTNSNTNTLNTLNTLNTSNISYSNTLSNDLYSESYESSSSIYNKFIKGGSNESEKDIKKNGDLNIQFNDKFKVRSIDSDSKNNKNDNEKMDLKIGESLIVPLKENIFYKMFNFADSKVSKTLENYVPQSLIVKILWTIGISAILLYIYHKVTDITKSTTSVLYDNCKMTEYGPRCSFDGSKKIEGNEGVYLIKTSNDNNIPISNEIGFYLYLNQYNKISLITDNEVERQANLKSDSKKSNELIFLFKKARSIYVSSENQKIKTVLKNINHKLNVQIFELDKLKLKSEEYKGFARGFKDLVYKMKESLGFSSKDIYKELNRKKKESKFGGKRVFDEQIEDSVFYENIIKDDLGYGSTKTLDNVIEYTNDKFNEELSNLKNSNTKFNNKIKKLKNDIEEEDLKQMQGGDKGGYAYSVIFKDKLTEMINDLNLYKKLELKFNSKRLEWIIDSSRDKFIIKSKYNPNISLYKAETRFSVKKYYGDKKLFERKLEVKNMFKSFKNLSKFTSNLKKKILNIKDNYNIYYRIFYDENKGKKYLQVNNTNSSYIVKEDQCTRTPGILTYTGNTYKMCNPFVLKLLCENDNKCKSIIQSNNASYCMLTDKENIGGDESTLKYCDGVTSFKQERNNKKNNFSDLIEFDNLSNKSISNWQLIKVSNL
tara:strand:- start:2181 stop:4151 length:1971 start_codon:yes stop_codon:yes gene_type:complete